MKMIVCCLIVGLSLAAESGRVDAYSDSQLAQQQRMTDCSAEAKASGRHGAERRAFMRTCLSGGHVTAEIGAAGMSGHTEESAVQRQARCEAQLRNSDATGPERQSLLDECVQQPMP